MKIPNAIHKFVLHKKKKKYGKYVCTSSYRNKQKTNSRKSMLQLAKKIISQLFIRKNIVIYVGLLHYTSIKITKTTRNNNLKQEAFFIICRRKSL